MISHKHISRFIAWAMLLAVGLCLAAIVFSDRLAAAAGTTGVSLEYESKLFDTSQILDVNILINEDDWNNLLKNAISEEYYTCDVQINDETFYQVGIRPKGNTSLSTIVNDPDTDRYSFKLEFDQYIDGQTCYGLDKLILNNNYADAASMKEAMIYDMFQYLGADASLYNYAKISVNGEYWGVYLALEAVEDSFLLRNYGTANGNLYKPEGMGLGNGGGSPASGSGGADLNYTDDELDSYSVIWDGEVTDSGKSDHKRVISALKNIAEGTDLEQSMDIDNLLRYMAVHIFSVNDDSLSGTMAHNYYLYESSGKLNLIPWDYNLALGGMNAGGMGPGSRTSGASSVINSPIDDAFSSTDFFDTLMADETCHSQYYTYLQQLVEEYVNGGGFETFYTKTRSLIDSLVETDPTAFYTYEEYNTAAETLYQVVSLRGESILGQINGTIPSTREAQQSDSSALVDASDLDLTVMGTMNAGGGGQDEKGGPGVNDRSGAGKASDADTASKTSSDSDSTLDSENRQAPPGGMQPPGNMQTPNNLQTPDVTQAGSENSQNPGMAQAGSENSQNPDMAQAGSENSQNPDIAQAGSENSQNPDMTQAGSENSLNSDAVQTAESDSSQTSEAKTAATEDAIPANASADETQETTESNEQPGNFEDFNPQNFQGGNGGPQGNIGGDFTGDGLGMPGGSESVSSNSTLRQNLILLGISFALLTAALIFTALYRRKIHFSHAFMRKFRYNKRRKK